MSPCVGTCQHRQISLPPLFCLHITWIKGTLLMQLLNSYSLAQRCKLYWRLGTRRPVRYGTSSRILRASPALFVMSRIFAVTYALFWIFFSQFAWFPTFVGHFWNDFEHFLIAFISRFRDNGSGALKAYNYLQVCSINSFFYGRKNPVLSWYLQNNYFHSNNHFFKKRNVFVVLTRLL